MKLEKTTQFKRVFDDPSLKGFKEHMPHFYLARDSILFHFGNHVPKCSFHIYNSSNIFSAYSIKELFVSSKCGHSYHMYYIKYSTGLYIFPQANKNIILSYYPLAKEQDHLLKIEGCERDSRAKFTLLSDDKT